jgi:sarcosine oxidase, subunit beta
LTVAGADIVIIGGGVIGASAAHHLAERLAERGARDVVLVERGAICSGETAKSGGFIQTHWDRLSEIRMIAKAREVFQHWDERIGGTCGWVQNGYLHVTGTRREASVRATHQLLLDEGLPSHWLDPVQLKELQPLINTDDLIGGAYEPSSGWADPVATTRSLVESARRRGVTIREGVTVHEIRHAGGKITGLATSDGEIACRVVIVAAGPSTPRLHVDREAPLPIQLERGQVCYLDRPGGLPEREIGFYDEVTGLYTHTEGDTNLVGINWPFELVTDPEHYDRELDPEYLRGTRWRLAHRFPRMRTSKLVRSVVGLYDFTPDGQPIVDGPLGIDGYYVAAGFSGIGFKSAPTTGLAIAELVLDGRVTSVNIDHLRLSRFYASASGAAG